LGHREVEIQSPPFVSGYGFLEVSNPPSNFSAAYLREVIVVLQIISTVDAIFKIIYVMRMNRTFELLNPVDSVWILVKSKA
jgi:hypothetical protein